MSLCDKCAADCRHAHAIEPGEVVVQCGAYKPPMTNADRIRSMSDKELAKFLLSCDDGNFLISVCSENNCAECRDETTQCSGNCMPAVMKWLQRPAEVSDAK